MKKIFIKKQDFLLKLHLSLALYLSFCGQLLWILTILGATCALTIMPVRIIGTSQL